jgi:nucleoid-associated protein YgaU
MAQKPKPEPTVGLYQGGYLPKIRKKTRAGRRREVYETERGREKATASRAGQQRSMTARMTTRDESTRMGRQVKGASAPLAASRMGGVGRKRVTVKTGDTLSAIAKREGVSLAALRQANKGRAVLNRIYSGSKVIIPKKK